MIDLCLQNRLSFGTTTLTWGMLLTEAESFWGDPSRLTGRRFAFVVDNPRQTCQAVVYGFRHGLDWGVIERGRLSTEVAERFAEEGVALYDAETGAAFGADPVERPVQPGRITVLTSGTTGLLKLIPHTARSLNTFARVRDLPEAGWFLPYQVGSYAWYQMICLSLFMPGQHLILGDMSDLSGSFDAALRTGAVTAISSTPTFWRYALMTVPEELLAAAPLRSISLGGEIVDQAILNRLAALYPAARLRHIYASSEAGAAIVVSDGKAGFPATFLEQTEGAIQARLEDGRLFLKTPYRMTDADGAAAAWLDTGDLVELRDDRVYFCGRAGNAMINVGGQKAFPPDIEAHLMEHPEVVWAQVSARRAPLVGHLPMASVVLRRPYDADKAEEMLTRHCDGRLAEYAIPRIWDFLETVPLRASLKS